tara:strand:- start:866 stop:1150 length:285 start_codon:yes stop_codon:yes gene_type:complete
MTSEYERGFAAGYVAAISPSMQKELTKYPTMTAYHEDVTRKPKKRKQTGKAAILTRMTKPIWDKYKKGKGKQTYFDIRSGVSRSAAYKKKTKGM